ncbi:ubiquitin-conjugating enzyme E2 O protein [Dioscorea alata]|uniref:Ubiquitin-conjugating enzyme E2 O protein n=1 Tax=Dioscorea alata TaxID=55571 RepID=A0ACB7TUZ4_DIOAL|nr:ubiquitin-conjugating enzyme E2 O protein [Dioscorea alata]
MDVFVSDLDSESYSEGTDSEDQDDGESSYSGHAQNILSSLDDSIGKIDNFLAFERGFVHGDIVCSISDPSGQLGRILDVDMIVDLETSSGELIKGINSKKLLKIQTFAIGDYVVHGPWLGRITKLFDKVTILYSDGSKSEVMTGGREVLTPVSPSLHEDAPFPYYAGQHVRIKLPVMSKPSRWLCGPWKETQNEGIICNVEVGLVHVNWIASVMTGSDSLPFMPHHLQNPQVLTSLSCFPYANWQIGDWCTLPHDDFDNQKRVLQESTYCDGPQYVSKMQSNLGMNRQDLRQMFVIARTRTKVDVLWQSGDLSVGLDPQTLHPVNNVGDHDFWPEQFVLEKVTSDDVVLPGSQRVGIVKSVDAQERTVKVKWMVPDLNLNENVMAEPDEETVSAYELIEHPDFSYCIGDVIFKLPPSFPDSQPNGPRQLHPLHGKARISSSPLSGKDLHDTSVGCYDENATAYLSCIGNVIGFKTEGVEVRWASGLTSKVHPSEIYGLDKLDDPPTAPTDNVEVISENISEQMVEQETLSWRKEDKVKEISLQDDAWDSGALLFPRAAICFLTNVAKSLFSSIGSTSLPGTWHELSTEEPQPDVGDLSTANLNPPIQAKIEQKEHPPVLPGNDKAGGFEKFIVVDDYSDHHFVMSNDKRLAISQVKSGWLKKLHQEWSILESNLPDSIYVRVYEDRIDLLRAAIIGAPGTPYHDGLFFFDICLPSDYPHEPPLVHYNSGGLRLNPNLYESGKVCLSLLNTWTGTGTEAWNPESSTILQVLLSLQALVLNDKPYFNEAGYDKQVGKIEGEKNSITYNENAFLLSLKSMLYILNNPPKHFEPLVSEHFACRSHSILHACKAYMDGAQIGSDFNSEKPAGEILKGSSTGFKLMLAKLFPKLVSGFTDKGIDCGHFLNQVKGVSDASKSSCSM